MSHGSLPPPPPSSSSWMGIVCGRDARADCSLNVIDAARNLLSTFSWTLILIYTFLSQKRCTIDRPPVRYAVHDLRWACAATLVAVHLADFGEALLAKSASQVIGLSLCLPLWHALAVCYSCVYFDRMEVWRRGVHLMWLCPFWLAEMAVICVRFPPSWTCQLESDGRCIQTLTVRIVTSWARLALSCVLLAADGVTALQVRKEEASTRSITPCNTSSNEIPPKESTNRETRLDRSLDSVFLPADTAPSNTVQTVQPSCYRHHESNLASRATFYWLNPLLWSGYRTPLEQQHLGPLPDLFKSSHLGRNIRDILQKNTSLWKCYLSFSWQAVLLGGWLKFGGDLVGYVAPLGIQVIVTYANSSSKHQTAAFENGEAYYPSVVEFLSNGYIMAGIIFLSSFLQGALSQASSHVLCTEGIRLKTALQSFLYEKSLRLSSLSGVTDEPANESVDTEDQKALQLDAGTFSQLLTEDCGNVMVLLCLCHYIWAIPLKLAILLYLLHNSLGFASVIAAILCLVIMVPAQFLLGKRISLKNKESMREADRRLAKIHEWLANMKLFRLYAWEKVGMRRIEEVRDRELGHLWSYSLQWAWATFLTQASTVALTLLTFVLYPCFSSESVPAAAEALSGLALINQFTVPLTIIPVIVPDLIGACNSTLRLHEFFTKPEINGQRCPHPAKHPSADAGTMPAERLSVRTLENIVEDDEFQSDDSDSGSSKKGDTDDGEDEGYVIKINQATFSWARDSTVDSGTSDFRLTGISLQVPKRRLTVIVGHVGSGKSSLLMALLGELNLESGGLTWDPSCSVHQIGYVAQKPWLMHASLRDNILFGNAMHPKRYWKVIEACSLSQDIELLRQKDATLIGSRGQNVSGGQRARIALARAVYSPANTVLLDDPFSALDPPVAQEVFRNAIQHILLRHGRNVIMTTNQLEFARMADHVVVVDSGKVSVQGSAEYVGAHWPELRAHPPESAAHPSKAKDRWNKLRLVTKTWGYVMSASRRKDEPDESTDHRWKRRSSRLNALSIHMSHDLPLLTDEMMIEDLMPDGLSRDRTYNSSIKSLKTRSSGDPAVPRSLSLKRPGIGGFLMRRRPRSRDRFSLIQHHPSDTAVSLHPLAGDSSPPVRCDADGSVESNARKPVLFRLYSTPVATKRTSSLPTPETDPVDKEMSVDSQKSTVDISPTPQQEGIRRLLSTVSGFSEEMPSDSDVERGLLQDPAAADEERQYGRVPRRLYWLYGRSCGFFLTACFFAGSIGWQSARLGTDYFLVVYKIETRSSQNSTANPVHQEDTGLNYLLIYTALSIASVVLALTANILGQSAGNQGRKRLHENLLLSLSRCYPRFFDEQPTGRLLNRFSTDMSMIDKKLATAFQRLVQFVLMCLSAIVVNVFITPYSLVIAAIIVTVFYMLQRFFRTSARELQRLESLTKAPVVSHLTETLSGLSTVRAFGQQRRFLHTMHEQLDAHTAAVLVLNTTNRWLGFALDSLGATAVLAATILALLVPDKITPGQVGLAISYTLMTPIYLQWVVRFWSELEMYFNAVERVLDYSNLPPESDALLQPKSETATVANCREDWPRTGNVRIENLYAAYGHDLEPVLRDLSLTVRHGQKVGICGRTGSGKSTLVNAIFRLAFTTAGAIRLDGVDIATLEPHYLRSRLSAVPQDTLVLAGTLRDNLDPERVKEDADLWCVLEAVQLKETFKSAGLDCDLWKGGSCRLSVGQQQLLCLARAALRPSPLLLLDEPSSALDAEAEQTLYHCLDSVFHDRTILLVAHRLSTLRRCDWVCVMKDGQLEAQGPPDEVLEHVRIEE